MKGYFKDKIRPCKCGSEDVELYYNGNDKECIKCNTCGISTREYNSDARDLLFKDWNNRPNFDKAIDEIYKEWDFLEHLHMSQQSYLSTEWRFYISDKQDELVDLVEELTGLDWNEGNKIYKMR